MQQLTLSNASFDPIGIIKTVAGSILEVFLLCLAGYVLSVKGIIDSKSKNTLNKINVSFFTPALMFSKVAFSLTSEKLVDLYVVPLSFIIITLTSLIVAWLLTILLGLRQAERNFCLSFAMFMNSNSLPIALMTSLITTIHGQDGLQWGADDSKSKQLGRSLTYLVVFSTMGLIFRWSVGVKLLSASVPQEEDHQSPHVNGLEDGIPSDDEATPFLADDHETPPISGIESERQYSKPKAPDLLYSPSEPVVSTSPSLPRTRTKSSQISFASTGGSSHVQPSNACLMPPVDQHNDLSQPRLHRSIFHSFPNVRDYSTRSLSTKRQSIATSCTSYEGSIASDSSIDDSINPGQQRTRQGRRRSAWFRHWIKHMIKTFKLVIIRPISTINRFMTPPLYAAFMSLIVVALPGLQQFLEKITPLQSALKSAGNVSVPLTLVVLGAYFNTTNSANSPRKSHTAQHVDPEIVAVSAGSRTQSQHHKAKRAERLTILASILSRMIITPLILIPLLFAILRYFHAHTGGDEDWDRPERFHEDPCFILVTVLLIGAPPAITLAQMTSSNPFPIGTRAFKIQAIQNSKFENLVSKTLFISYAVFTPPTTIALVVLGLLIEANR